MSENVVNLSNCTFSKAEVPPLAKGIKFCPTPNSADKSVVKEDLGKFDRTLKWHYVNDKRTFDPNLTRPKSKYNPNKTDSGIELCLTNIEKKLLSCLKLNIFFAI